MQKNTKLLSRSMIALALGTALTLASAGLASASSHHDDGNARGTCASGRVSAFDYTAGGHDGGYVSAVSSTSVTVDLWNGTSTTFTISPTATFTEGGSPTTAASLVVGDRVQIQTSTSDPTTATAINIELATLFGTVTSVSGNSILLKDPQGFTRTILVSSSTTYSQNGETAALSDVVDGARVIAAGTIDANGTSLDALTIKIGSLGTNEFVTGVVTAFSGSSLTVQTKGATSTVFTLTTNTLVKDGALTLSAADLAVGEHVGVEVNSVAATTALSVEISLASVQGVVTSVSGDTVVLSGGHGFSQTVLLSSRTQYFEGKSPGSSSDVVIGTRISAVGTVDANQTSLDALAVVIWNQVATPLPQTPNRQWNGDGFGHGGSSGHQGDSGQQRNFGQQGGFGNRGGQQGGHAPRGSHVRGH